jgi:hypothetical protein
MSDTLNRPMFKRGPDGQMRQTKFVGGIMRALPLMYKGAKYMAPKFTNLPYNINRMVNPRATGIQPPFVGKQGPMDFVPFVKGKPPSSTFDWRLKSWTDQFNTLKNKHGINNAQAFGFKGKQNVPQEVIDHLKIMPKMPWKRSLTEQGAYGLSANMLDNWMSHPDDPVSNIESDAGTISQDKPPSDRQPGLFASEGDQIEGPKIEGTNTPDDSVGDEYDGEPSDRQPGLFGEVGAAGGPIPDLVSEVVTTDDSVSPKSIEDYKKELQAVIGKEDSNMGSLMLMQLGLGMMAGKSYQPGFAGFAEILGKTGQEVLPMWMEHMQNKRKEDKEIALAAYDMLRQDKKAKSERELGLQDWLMKQEYEMNQWIQKEQYKQPFAGDESMIQVNNPMYTPTGERIDNWSNLKQTFSKSPEALYIMQNSDPGQIRVVNLNMTDAGMKAAGFGDMNLTKSQRGENVMLANTYERNIGQILNFLMDPEIGLHSGNFKTGSTGAVLKTLRFLNREVTHAWDTITGQNSSASQAGQFMWGTLKSAESDMMENLLKTNGIISGSGNVENSAHGDQTDIIYGTYDDGQGNMITGNFATEQYVRNLTNNQFYDVNEQLVNMMGFLEARLKQPTGRLLADTIKSSIQNLKSQGFMQGDPVQISNKMHFFVKRLYEAYASHAIKGGAIPKVTFEGGRGLVELSIPNYNKSYLGFTGTQALDQGINLGWMNSLPNQQTQIQTGGAPGNIYDGKNEVTLNAPEDLSGLMKYANGNF